MCPKSFDRSKHVTIALAALIVLTASLASGQGVDYGGYRPSYQGYGVETPGGRGGNVCRVTSLSDASWPAVAGTLRFCVESTSPRFVIFEVSGTINLQQGALYVKAPYMTIAGQTAPSPGILIRGPGLVIDTHDVVVQHVRVRVGNIGGEPVGVWLRDDADQVVIDHVSISWAVWTSLIVAAYNPGHPPGRVTITDSIIAESLACSGVNYLIPCDPDTYPWGGGSSNSRAIGIGDNWNHAAPRVTLLRNISANSNDRHPEIGGRTQTILVNNLIYNPSQTPLSAIYFVDATGVRPAQAVVQGNVLVAGPTTPGNDGYVPTEFREDGEAMLVRVHATVNPGTRIYMDGNYDEKHCGGTACLESPAANWMVAKDYMHDWNWVNIRAETPPLELENLPLWSTLPASEVEPYLLAHAGARPLDRDAVDARTVYEISTRTGSVPNRTSEKAGPGTADDGFPILEVNRRQLTPPSNPNAVVDGVGRTRIEEWLEAFARELE